jgi:hypothetical protein
MWRRREWLAVALAAAVIRLAWPDLVSFTADEAIHGELAMSIANLDFSNVPVVGLPSVGIRNSALFMHLLGLASLPSRHPLAGLALVAGLNVGLVALTHRFVRERFGSRAAWWTTTFFLTAPWQVLYARNMWPPSCVGPLAFLVFYRVVQWLEGPRPALGLILPTALAQVVPQMHFSGFVVPAWLALMTFGIAARSGWRRGPALIGAWLVGLVIGTATWAPWIHWQHVSNRWADFPAVRRLLEPSRTPAETSKRSVSGQPTSTPARDSASAVDAAARIETGDRPANAWIAIAESLRMLALLSTGEEFRFWFGTEPESMPDLFPVWQQRAVHAAALLTLGISLIGLVALTLDRSRHRHLAPAALLWLILPIALLAVLRPRLVPHYVLITWPIPAILFGLGADRLAGRSPGFTSPPLPGAAPASATVSSWLQAGTVAALVALIALVHLTELDGWRRYLAAGRHPGTGHFQHSYRHRADVARSIVERYGNALDAYPAGFFSGQNPAYRPAVRHEGGRRGLQLRGEGANYIAWLIEPNDVRDLGIIADNLRRFRGVRVDQPEARWFVGPTEVLVFRVRR